FLVYGNVYETACKPGKPAKGLSEMRRLIERVDVPVYAIGGIGPGNIAEVRNAGASGACLMSGLMRAEDPALAVENLRRSLRYG
ncbi:MAG: thiamine phosphate synthase, partial [Candidatus Methanomethylophilaceae archaeon]|nr:thiamine phosphate synthase [Candidatus Methanomethylophilaceae archaeon]